MRLVTPGGHVWIQWSAAHYGKMPLTRALSEREKEKSVDLFRVDPGHQFAEFPADDFDWVILVLFAEGLEVLAAGFGFVDPFFGERAVLYFLQDPLHLLFGFGGDDTGATGVVAVLGGVGDAVAHVVEAALVKEVDDELELVHAFEVGHLGLVAGFDERFETGLY